MSTTESLEGALAQLWPVSLAELERKAAMLDRRDHKYIVDTGTLATLLHALAAHYDVLQIDGRRQFEYLTRYFDDEALNGYLDHLRARRRRSKVRVRRYADSGALWLEVKLRTRRGSSSKKRRRCEPSTWEALAADDLRHVDDCHRGEYGRGLQRRLAPLLDMRYRRITLVAREGGERVTIDAGLTMWGGGRERAVREGLCIVETKSAHGRSAADRVLRALHHHPVKHCSKYCLAVAALGLCPLINRFRPALSRLGLLALEPGRPAARAWQRGMASAALLATLGAGSWAQTASPADATVEVTGSRSDEAWARRNTVAAALLVTRDEIERMGDTNLTDLLKRLPGVVLSGRPGRDSTPRLRGLGSGYTQILVDGERAPKNFSLDMVPPEQVERIEILRSATAETGTRAVAGTINIVLSEGAPRRVDTLRVSAGGGTDQGARAGVMRRKADIQGAFSFDLLAQLDHRTERETRTTDTVETVLVNQRVGLAQLRQRIDQDKRDRLSLGGTLRWSLGEGRRLTLTPQFQMTDTGTQRQEGFLPRTGSTAADYDHALGEATERQWQARLLAGWRAPLDQATRYELSGQIARRDEQGDSRRNQYNVLDSVVGTRSDSARAVEDRLRLSGRLMHWLDEAQQLSAGLELEGQWREESRRTVDNGTVVGGATGETVPASTRRSALYAQHQWLPGAALTVQTGLRWEGIETRSTQTDGTPVANRSSVLSPLLHLSLRPTGDPADRLRLGLTHTYRPATLQELTAQPVLSAEHSATATNSATSPDKVGNPLLRPERAVGIDLGWDRDLGQGSVFGAHAFARRIQDPIRTLLTLEQVSWSPSQRWVLRPTNLGTASTWGVDFDLRLRAGAHWATVAGLDLRANLGLYRSRVDGVPGPDNRLDGQPPGVLNLGADYRLSSLPLMVGVSLNLNPAYTVQVSDSETLRYGSRRTVDAYALWTLGRHDKLRLTAGNLGPRHQVRGTTLDAGGVRHEILRTTTTGAAVTLRWEHAL